MTHKWVYKTALWQRLRNWQLQTEPLCRYCKDVGDIIPAIVVDHIKAHKGDRGLAFNPENLQSLCKSCHDRHKQVKDKGGVLPGCDVNGYPLDPDHPWGV